MKEPGSILVVQLRRIGDVILTTPAVAALKARYPKAALDFLVEAPGAEALQFNPHIREILVYDGSCPLSTMKWWSKIRSRGYDWVVDFLGTPRSAMLTFFSGAAVKAGPAHVGHSFWYNTPLTQSTTTHYGALEKIRLLERLGVSSRDADFLPKVYLARREEPKNVVGLIPASRKETRRWPAQRYADLGKLLRERFGCDIRVFWGPGERALAEEVAQKIGDGARATPETKNLTEAAKLLADCRLVVTNCNGPKHLAVALGVPTVTVHGASDPVSWTPNSPHHVFVRRDELPCIGCASNSCPTQIECLRDLPAERVFEAARKLLEAATEAKR
jgi:ADP-heptose:LPS heptosyltransferase